MSENKTNVTQQQQMVRGAAWLTASNFISRLLGCLSTLFLGMLGWANRVTKPMLSLVRDIIFMPFSF